MDAPKLLSPKSIAKLLDCSLSMFYRDVKEKRFPAPDVKLWGDSTRGFRWHEDTVRGFIIAQEVRRSYADDEDAEAPLFVPIDVEKILKLNRRKVA
jgi:predicted DNA-binding transcriptional regulator AlpA